MYSLKVIVSSPSLSMPSKNCNLMVFSQLKRKKNCNSLSIHSSLEEQYCEYFLLSTSNCWQSMSASFVLVFTPFFSACLSKQSFKNGMASKTDIVFYLPWCLEHKHAGKETWLKSCQTDGKACLQLPKLEEGSKKSKQEI